MVSKDEYGQILSTALENAAQNAEKAFKIEIPRQFTIEMVGAGNPRRHNLSRERVVDLLYINEDQFWLLINIMVIEIDPEANMTVVSLSVTGHGPGRFEDTFHYANGTGPFHQVLPMNLKVSRLIPLGKAPEDFIP